MARSRIKSEYRKAISLLQSYFHRSKVNPFNSELEQAIQDRIEEVEYPYITGDLNCTIKGDEAVKDFLAERLVFAKESDRRLRQLKKRKQVIEEIIDQTPPAFLTVIKEVYVFDRWNIEREGCQALFLNKEAIYRQVREWFEEFEDRFYT